ncbi:hypothetical protein [Deinococcus koreensis]|uniref:hypothetical protein n=1 Tax=Deinococcus koreensis TaxID=2054903 RepID=UPI001056F496|nr:hypothetical protein [Deinococcus koreensis]
MPGSNGSRLDANHALLELLLEAIDTMPDQRFGQLLVNLDILKLDGDNRPVDPYDEEPTITLRRAQRRWQQLRTGGQNLT